MLDCYTCKLCFDCCMPGFCPMECCKMCFKLCKPMGCEIGCWFHLTCMCCPSCMPECGPCHDENAEYEYIEKKRRRVTSQDRRSRSRKHRKAVTYIIKPI